VRVGRPPAPTSSGGTGLPSVPQHVDTPEQRARDSDAKAILESELRKAQTHQTELQTDYNNGQHDKQGDEARNYQKYLDRVADMKAALDRNQADIDSIKRELARYDH
jgi:flagellar basal body rod protein FlgB